MSAATHTHAPPTLTRPRLQPPRHGQGLDDVGALDPRESMRGLPAVVQYPLTFLTGKPLRGQRPLRLSPTYHLLGALAHLAIGCALSCAGFSKGGWWLLLLLPGWAATLHGMRNLRMLVFHQCSHDNMYRKRRLDAVIGHVIAALLVVQDFDRYSKEHVRDHHSAANMTLRDPTVQAILLSLELRPGMSRRAMWQRLLGKLVSPRFHTRFAVGRVRSLLAGDSRAEKLIAGAAYAAVVAACALTGTLSAVAVAWLVPLFPLFQVSNTLRLCVKHTFPPADGIDRRGKERMSTLTNAIFIGEPTPDGIAGSRLGVASAWARWALRMLLVHVPSRYLVLTGDTVVHDYHHRYPRSRRWHDYIFARQDDVDRGHPGWPPYREVWGLKAGIDIVFDSLEQADPADYDAARIADVSDRELFAAFDD